jgi:transcriptional regulator with XRE-family HTH domain
VRLTGDDQQTLESLAANLKRWRSTRRLTQDALAEQAQTSVFTLQALERARSNPSFVIVLRLSRALVCSLDDLANPAPLQRRRGRPSRTAAAPSR